MLALTLVFSCSNQEVSLQTISTEENNPYKWDESFHVNSSTRASESPNEAYEFVPDGLTSGVYPGLVLSGSSISAPPLRPTALSTLKDSIDVCFDMPGYYCERIYPRGTSYKNGRTGYFPWVRTGLYPSTVNTWIMKKETSLTPFRSGHL